MTEEDEAGLAARWKPTGLAVVVAMDRRGEAAATSDFEMRGYDSSPHGV